jgi:hypothetical protein
MLSSPRSAIGIYRNDYEDEDAQEDEVEWRTHLAHSDHRRNWIQTQLQEELDLFDFIQLEQECNDEESIDLPSIDSHESIISPPRTENQDVNQVIEDPEDQPKFVQSIVKKYLQKPSKPIVHPQPTVELDKLHGTIEVSL